MGRSLRGRLGWLATTAFCLASLAVPAHAASVDDPPYAKGPLDLKRLEATKHDAGAPIDLKLITYGRWVGSLLDSSGRNRIFFLFNPDREGRAEFIGEVFFLDGRLWMRITRANGTLVRRIRVYHPRSDTIRATVPRGLPNPDGNALLAATERYRTDTGPCASGCHDRIPNEGWLKLTPGQ